MKKDIMRLLRSLSHPIGNFYAPLLSRIRHIVLLSGVSIAFIASGEELVTKDTDVQAIYFFDTYAISQTLDMERRFFQPERVDDFHWEDDNPAGGGMEYVRVIYDPQAELYKMWYLMHRPESRGAICYAESRDGLEWDRVELPKDTDRRTPEYHNAGFLEKSGPRKALSPSIPMIQIPRAVISWPTRKI